MTAKLRLLMTLCVMALLLGTGVAMAADPHSGGSTGRPDQSCEELGNPPGNSTTAPGSPFNPNGVSGTKYAGEQPQNSKNGQASQYDVACFQQSQH